MEENITRKNSLAIKVWCLPDEKKLIEGQAKNCGLSSSTFLRKLGMGFQPKSTFDHLAVAELAKINGDLGRLGGLLKMFLSNSERAKRMGKSQTEIAITDLLRDIDRTQIKLFEKASSL